MKNIKGRKWYGYRSSSHVSLFTPSAWIRFIKDAGFTIVKVGSDAFWDVPYVPLVPKLLQYILLNIPNFLQILTGRLLFPPIGESIYVVAYKARRQK
jgi:hypothetical protein